MRNRCRAAPVLVTLALSFVLTPAHAGFINMSSGGCTANCTIDTLTIAESTANTTALTVSGYSLTGSNAQALIDAAGTWNTSGTPTALKINITDTASNAASLLADFQVGGSSKWRVDKVGNVTQGGVLLLPNGSGGTPALSFAGDPDTGFAQLNGLNTLDMVFGGTSQVFFNASRLTLRSSQVLGFASGAPSSAADTELSRSSANEASLGANDNLKIPNIKSTTGTLYVCVDTAGLLVSSASPCSGT